MPKRKLVIIAIIFATLLFLGSRSYYTFAINLQNSTDETVVDFVIEGGQSVEEIAKSLEREGLIRSAALFRLYTNLSNLSPHLQAGAYQVPKNLSLTKVADLLQHGTFEDKLTFIEGWRREEMAEYISSKFPPARRAGAVQSSKLSATDFLQESKGFEGRLFPDTYFISKETTARELVETMVENFGKKHSEQSNISGLTPPQALIIASIVEREARSADDRPLVAGILIKRFLNGWALQADATIQYALGYQDGESASGKGGWWKKHLTEEDLKVKSPYNTYLNPGLPPTPISNPGLDSLKATFNPTQTDYWYYLSDRDGIMHFAKNNEEHNQNVAKYLK